MDELKQILLIVVVGAAIGLTIKTCEDKSKENKDTKTTNKEVQFATPSRGSSITVSQDPNDDWEPVIEEPPTSSNSYSNLNSYSTDNTYEEELNRYDNYKETDNCVDGIVVYEGDDDYYIVETRKGLTIIERYSGVLNEGDRIRGELNRYGFTYVIRKYSDTEVRIYIEDYMLSNDDALEWMRNNNHLR